MQNFSFPKPKTRNLYIFYKTYLTYNLKLYITNYFLDRKKKIKVSFIYLVQARTPFLLWYFNYFRYAAKASGMEKGFLPMEWQAGKHRIILLLCRIRILLNRTKSVVGTNPSSTTMNMNDYECGRSLREIVWWFFAKFLGNSISWRAYIS